MNRKFVSRLLLIFPVAIIVYIVLFRWYYFIVYPVSVVNPYFYYQYSPGFWSVDFSFWLFTPLYFLWFRRNKAGTFVSLIYALCLDASAVGLFLMFFCFVYGIDPFTSAYYTYAFVLMFLFIIPIFDMHFSKQSILLFLVFPMAGIIWRLTGTGGVHYTLSSSVIIDLFMIFYCFFFMFSFRNITIRRIIHAKN